MERWICRDHGFFDSLLYYIISAIWTFNLHLDNPFGRRRRTTGTFQVLFLRIDSTTRIWDDAMPRSTSPPLFIRLLTKANQAMKLLHHLLALLLLAFFIINGKFSFDDTIYEVFVDTIVPERFVAFCLGIVAAIFLISVKRYLIRTGQTTGILPAFVTLWISTVNLLLIDQILCLYDKNCDYPFRWFPVPVHLLSLFMDICLTILLLPLHILQLAPAPVILIEKTVKKMMAMSFAAVGVGYIMIIGEIIKNISI